jgi:hypothetical protein
MATVYEVQESFLSAKHNLETAINMAGLSQHPIIQIALAQLEETEKGLQELADKEQ